MSSQPQASPSPTAASPPAQKPPKAPRAKVPFKPSPEQLAAIEAKRAARAAAKAAEPASAAEQGDASKRSKEQLAMGKFLQREWVELPAEKGEGGKEEGQSVRVVSWNVSLLAPTCLRVG
jgi:hypothetical protein